MDKNQIKRGAVVAASAATILGLVFATPSFAANSKTSKASTSSSSSSTTTPPTFGGDNDGDHGKGGHGKGGNGKGQFGADAGVTKTVTVDVPADGKTYKLVVTDTTVRPAPADVPAGAPKPPKHVEVVAVTGTGTQTVTIKNLRPGTYSVELVAVSSTQSLTVDQPTGSTPAPSVTPLVP